MGENLIGLVPMFVGGCLTLRPDIWKQISVKYQPTEFARQHARNHPTQAIRALGVLVFLLGLYAVLGAPGSAWLP